MRRQTTAVGATLTACGILLGTTVVAVAATPQRAQANAALRYLYSQVGSDGSIAGSMGATEDAVISDADSGYDPATLRNPSSGKSVYDYLSSHAGSITTAGGAAKYVLTWLAAGKPAAIDGSALLTKLNKRTAKHGYLEPNGAFHNADSNVETANAYSQSLAVLADLAAGHALPAHATRWLTCAQRPDGGFGYAINDAAPSPPAFCGDTSSDTNSTSIILQALGAAGISSADGAAGSYLHAAQQADGGFGFNGSGPSDPDSDATVIQALVAAGQDPTGPAWSVAAAHNPMADMESFADPHGGGGYVFPGNTAPDAFTTSGIPQALALKPYGAATAVVAGSSPPPPATVTPTPTGAVSGVTVPTTGADGGAGGASALAIALLALGAIAVLAASARRRPSPRP